MATDPRGNYAADTLLHVLQLHSGLDCQRWTSSALVTSNAFLVGSGQHWQAIIKDKEDKWYVMERYTRHAVQDLRVLLVNRSKTGAVYQLIEPGVATTLTDTNSRKRLREDTTSSFPNPDHPDRVPTSPPLLPSDKRQHTWETVNDRQKSFTVGHSPSRPPHHKPHLEAQVPHIPLDLPPEFQANPGFNFQLRNVVDLCPFGDTFMPENPGALAESLSEQQPGSEGIQALLDVFPESQEGPLPTEPSARPRRLIQFFNQVVDVVSSPMKAFSERSEAEDRPRRTVSKPQLYQSEEVAEEEKQRRKKGTL